MKIKTIDVQAKEWFDKINGNSYFSARVTLNYGMKGEVEFKLPMQYGYGDHYQYVVLGELIGRGWLKSDELTGLVMLCRDQKIILRTNLQEDCKKRDVVAWGN